MLYIDSLSQSKQALLHLDVIWNAMLLFNSFILFWHCFILLLILLYTVTNIALYGIQSVFIVSHLGDPGKGRKAGYNILYNIYIHTKQKVSQRTTWTVLLWTVLSIPALSSREFQIVCSLPHSLSHSYPTSSKLSSHSHTLSTIFFSWGDVCVTSLPTLKSGHLGIGSFKWNQGNINSHQGIYPGLTKKYSILGPQNYKAAF